MRPVLACLVALLGVLSLAAPAAAAPAEPTVPVSIGLPGGGFTSVDVPAREVPARLRELRAQPGIRYAHVAQTLEVARTPNDPLFGQQWGPVADRAPEAWDISVGGPSVVVAVVDSGVDPSAPDLAGAVLSGVDFVDNDMNAYDEFGHGTAVAGVVAARGNNGTHLTGYCWTCTILPVRVLGADGSGSSGDIALGIRWAAENGADIINLSLGGCYSSPDLADAVSVARASGALVVAAAGNQDSKSPCHALGLTNPHYPAAYDGVIGVAAMGRTFARDSYSYYGSWVDVAAPGCVVVLRRAGSDPRESCGTSYAAPAVSGTLALAVAAFPTATPELLTAALLSTAKSVPGSYVTSGRIDAAALLDAVRAAIPMKAEAVRVAGDDRVATAVALSQRTHASAPAVVLARADNYADALAAAPLAGAAGAPVLLTSSGALDPRTAAELTRLGATTVWLAGGAGALSASVESAARALVPTVNRLAGATRYDTARLVAEQVGGKHVYVVNAAGWPDAVAVSALAALQQAPILLVERDSIPAATALGLAQLAPTSITVVGAEGGVSAAVAQALGAGGASVSRIAGADRYETSRQLATAAVAAGADGRKVWLATGGNWPDALAAGAAAASQGAVLLLVDGGMASSSSPAASWLRTVTPRELVIVGGVASVSAPVLSVLGGLLG